VAHEVSSSLLLLGTRAKTQGVEIVPKVEGPLPGLRGSRTQLQQVLVNLGTNALDAMKHGGVLTVRVHAHGSNIVIEVADTGCGIPEDIQRRVFEPFFTTKAVGEGTGLGLSLVYQIAQQHQGRADLVSSGPSGTVMRVSLPGVAVAPPVPQAVAVRPSVQT
jgi:two-component system, NtrC family, sensor kinase